VGPLRLDTPITTNGCGDWRVPTPNGDVIESRITVPFTHRPDFATLGLAFTGTWPPGNTATVTGRSSIIRYDPVTQGHRCLFQTGN
jgi:hypothetical protein